MCSTANEANWHPELQVYCQISCQSSQNDLQCLMLELVDLIGNLFHLQIQLQFTDHVHHSINKQKLTGIYRRWTLWTEWYDLVICIKINQFQALSNLHIKRPWIRRTHSKNPIGFWLYYHISIQRNVKTSRILALKYELW